MVVLQLTHVSKEFFSMSDEQRIKALDDIEAEAKKKSKQENYEEKSRDESPFPDWVDTIVEKLWKNAKYDEMNQVWQVAFRRKKLADQGFSDFKARYEKACKADKKKQAWADKNHLHGSIRDGIGAEVLATDEDLSESADEI